MNDGFEWQQILLACAMLLALFIYPVIVLWHDERRKARTAKESVPADLT
ncbi:hypothetical protein BH10ACT8_BH10ACT8_26870 [soil metagenome]|jgi:hypothetical protein